MKTQKISLANVQGKLSRNEMRSIMAGSGDDNPREVRCCLIGKATNDTNCGTCVASTGVPTCSTGYEVRSC
ncbi:hypothetical protein EYY60_08790 [Flavobacterium zhairuonense]|uniref:hypothetical protein n=1 Tax=Flavobacterium zhairuonense TaxID=2493631 RepID=UPI0010511DFC|nr:hypothetical protein [Flavobacterium zhairuonense]KAF2511516.1 hypothetical protein EYY60_08790 [Flavobacterium zhairuonense]